ncbi:MAG TPA: PAS domain S-box protein, partial [Prosthecobacter sp.]
LYDYVKQDFVLGHEHVSELYGYKAGEIEKLKEGWFSIVHPDDLAEFREVRWRIMESGSDDVQTQRMRMLRKQGGYEWVQCYMRPFERDAEGHVVSEAGMAVVITPLVAAEEALREAQARSHNLLQSNAAAVVAFDKKFNIVDANPAACRLLGYAKKALLRLSTQDLAAQGHHADLLRLLRSIKDQQKPSQVVELALARQDDKPVAVLAASTSFRGADGDFEQGVLILMDITKRQQEQEGLRQEALFNKIMLEHAPVAIGLLNSSGHVMRVNSASQKLFGFELKEIKGQKMWKIPMLTAAETSASRRRFEELMNGATKTSAIIPMKTRKGEIRQVQVENTAVRTEDNETYVVSTGVDVTEQRKLEAEVIRVAEQEHIRIGHDLHDGVGQTLTGVASLVEALADSLEGQNKLDAQRIHTLVRTAITETRRLSHGLSPVAVKYRGLACGLELIAETVRENFRRNCIFQSEESMLVVSQDSEIHLFRIAQEAINNAIRHGGATNMRISLRRKSPTQGIMEIGDNGRGFPAGKSGAQQEGIGLRVMEHRAHLIGGELTIQASKGRGVRVVCHFPLGDA